MKIGRFIITLLIGGLIGGCIALFIDYNHSFHFFGNYHYATHSNVILISLICVALILVLSIYLIIIQKKAVHYKRLSETHIDEDEADSYDKKANLAYMQNSFIYYLELTISFIALFIIVLGNGNSSASSWALLPFMTTIISSVITGLFYRKFDSRYPKLGEKNYAEKLINILDEGERHIYFNSLFKTFYINLSLIMIGAIFLGFYSLETGHSQTLGIFILIILFIYNVFSHLLKTYKFYHS